MHKDVRKVLLDEEDEVKAEIELDIKDHIVTYVIVFVHSSPIICYSFFLLFGFSEDGEEQELDSGESPTCKRSRKAARMLRNLDKGISIICISNLRF